MSGIENAMIDSDGELNDSTYSFNTQSAVFHRFDTPVLDFLHGNSPTTQINLEKSEEAQEETLCEKNQKKEKKKTSRRRSISEFNPFITCLILAMPFGSYASLLSLFQDLRMTYAQKLGINTFVPRFLPSILTFILGPILGAASDRSLSKWGRRNVFLIMACMIVTVSGICYGGALKFFPEQPALVNFFFTSLLIGCLLFDIGLRARVMDIVPVEYQIHAQAAISFWSGLGNVGGLFSFHNSTAASFSSAINATSVLIYFASAIGIVILTTCISIYFRPEHPQDIPAYQPPLQLLTKECWEQIVYAPKLFRILCLIHFFLYFAWSTYKDQIYNWWGLNVYDGCKELDQKGCTQEKLDKYLNGLETGHHAMLAMNGFQFLVSGIFLFVLPAKIPNVNYFTRVFTTAFAIAAIALITAMSVDSFFLPLTFGSFVVTGMFRVVQIIFPFSVIGILSKEIQESIYGFNNNGLYIGVISLFSATSELTVQVYGTEKFAPLGTGNYMALPCVLFILSIGCTYSFRYAVTSSGSANGTSNEGETFSNREGQVDCL